MQAFKSEEQLQLVQRKEIEELFENIVTNNGTNAGDVKKLQDAGIYTCNGLMMHTKKNSTGIKGLSEAKVDKICEATEKIVNFGYITGSDALIKIAEFQNKISEHVAGVSHHNQAITELNAEITELNEELRCNYEILLEKKKKLDEVVEKQVAEISSKMKDIVEMNNYIFKLHMEKAEMKIELERAKSQADSLEKKVIELQNQVVLQAAVISNAEEEKRDAIRQLSFALEHYKIRYEEICRGLKH